MISVYLAANPLALDRQSCSSQWFEKSFKHRHAALTCFAFFLADPAAPTPARCRNTLSIMTDELGASWPLETVQQQSDEIEPLVLERSEDGEGSTNLLRRYATGKARQTGRTVRQSARSACGSNASISHLRKFSVAKRLADDYGTLTYKDDFESARWPQRGSTGCRAGELRRISRRQLLSRDDGRFHYIGTPNAKCLVTLRWTEKRGRATLGFL